MTKALRKSDDINEPGCDLARSCVNYMYYIISAIWMKDMVCKYILYLEVPSTDGNPLIATPENCNLPINCNFFLQPNQAYYKSG